MIVIIDAMTATLGGGSTYLTNLANEIIKNEEKNRYIFFVSENHFENIKLDTRVEVKVIPLRTAALKILYQQIVIPIMAFKVNATVILSVSDIAPLAAWHKVVLGIRNLNQYNNQYPKTSWPFWRLKVIHALSKLSVKKAKQVFFVSQHSMNVAKSQLTPYANKFRVIHHGVSPHFLAHEKPIMKTNHPYPSVSKPYLIYVSNLYEYKNTTRLVEAFAKCCEDDEFKYNLVVAGEMIDESVKIELPLKITSLNLQHRIHMLGKVKNQDLVGLYREASLFVFPSYRETFGHPLIEAMASSVPIAAAKAAATPEILGDAGIYFDPFDIDAIHKSINLVLQNDLIADELVSKGNIRVQEFLWGKTSRDTLNILCDAIKTQ